jgi:hypothetical protein
MKKLKIILAVLFLVVVVGLVYLFMNLGSIIKSGVETVGPKVTKTEVKLESVVLSPFSGSGKLKGLLVGNPTGYKTPSAIKLGEVEVQVNLSSLKSEKIVIEKVVINAPEITFEGGLSGNNLKQILANVESVAGGSGGKTEDTGTSKTIQIKDLTLTGAKISLSFTGMGGKTLSATMPDLHLTNIGTDDKGATVAQAVDIVMKEVVGNVDKIAAKMISSAAGDLTKGANSAASNQVDKATKGIQNLFKK